jgi:hypothetical protein
MDDSLGLVTPEVVDIGTAIASPTKEPEVPVVVSPAYPSEQRTLFLRRI